MTTTTQTPMTSAAIQSLDPSAVSDDDWAAFLYVRSNPKGVMAERWHHVSGCGRFFNVLRDTVSDTILRVYKAGEPRPTVGAERPET